MRSYFKHGSALETSLRWWRQALELQTSSLRPWAATGGSNCKMFVDARSTPPRVAAVLVADGRIEYSDMEPGQEVLAQFKSRKDGLIMCLELLSIAFGLSCFGKRIQGRNLELFSDNTGSNASSRFIILLPIHMLLYRCGKSHVQRRF